MNASKATQAGRGDKYLSLKQAELIYDAASFLPISAGLLFNTRLELNHHLLGADTERSAAKLVSDLTHELGMRVRSWTGADELHWLYVHERRTGGLATEIVAHVPAAAMAMTKSWLRQRLSDWCGGANEPGAWLLELPNPERESGWVRNRVARHWQLVRRLWRGLDSRIAHVAGSGERLPLLDLLCVPTAWRAEIGCLKELRRIGSSQGLGPAARKQAAAMKLGLVSAFKDAAWCSIDAGWELAERDVRRRELEMRHEAEERVRAEWPSDNLIEAANLQRALAELEASWPKDPRLRPRAWAVWWTATGCLS
jgi:hypothetical protein